MLVNFFKKKRSTKRTILTPIAQDMVKRWGLRRLKRLDGQYAEVFSGYDRLGFRKVVFKHVRSVKDYGREMRMLSAHNTHQLYPKLFRFDTETRCLLMQCAKPGTSLASYFPERDDEAVAVVCRLVQTLSQSPLPKEGEAPFLRDWLATLDKPWPIPPQFLEKARQLRDELLATPTHTVLLHGDLHHGNILQHGKAWMVIDPKGVVGEALYEVAVFLCNPIPGLLESPDAAHILTRRIALFAPLLNADEKRLSAWCFVHAVMAWCWCLEDGVAPDYFQRFVEMVVKDVII